MSEIKEFGIHIVRCPTPWTIGSTNLYLIERDEVCLIDAGVKTEDSISSFFEGLKSSGIEREKIKKIFITHGHTDHYGFAEHLREETGAEVFVPEIEVPKVSDGFFERMSKMIKERRDFFTSIGIPEALLPVIEFIPEHNAQLSEPLKKFTPLKWGERIDIGGENIIAIPLPGHTAGHAGYYLEKSKILFTGDHIMPLLQFNPLYDMTLSGEFDFHILKKYESSLDEILNMRPTIIAPGHRKILKDVEGVIKNRKNFIEKVRADVLEILNSSENPISVFELAKKLNPSLQEWQILFSWTIAFCILKEYELKGLVFSEERGGVRYYGKV
jgi:glyoxylase-like metal-dependent hydrolase (beta-lactamase superfamily II)